MIGRKNYLNGSGVPTHFRCANRLRRPRYITPTRVRHRVPEGAPIGERVVHASREPEPYDWKKEPLEWSRCNTRFRFANRLRRTRSITPTRVRHRVPEGAPIGERVVHASRESEPYDWKKEPLEWSRCNTRFRFANRLRRTRCITPTRVRHRVPEGVPSRPLLNRTITKNPG